MHDRCIKSMRRSTCFKCGTGDLGWSHEHHRLTGEWRLEKHQGCIIS